MVGGTDTERSLWGWFGRQERELRLLAERVVQVIKYDVKKVGLGREGNEARRGWEIGRKNGGCKGLKG